MDLFILCRADPWAFAEAYHANRMPPEGICEYEKHLEACPRCIKLLEKVRATVPASLVHQTEDGPVHLWAKLDGKAGWRAQIWGLELAGARRFETLQEANRYLRDSFAEMFPGHVCSAQCASLDEAAQERASAEMQFQDYTE